MPDAYRRVNDTPDTQVIYEILGSHHMIQRNAKGLVAESVDLVLLMVLIKDIQKNYTRRFYHAIGEFYCSTGFGGRCLREDRLFLLKHDHPYSSETAARNAFQRMVDGRDSPARYVGTYYQVEPIDA